MRNRFSGICYRCGERVEKQEGHFERTKGGWLLQHAECAIEYRGTEVGKSEPIGIRPTKKQTLNFYTTGDRHETVRT